MTASTTPPDGRRSVAHPEPGGTRAKGPRPLFAALGVVAILLGWQLLSLFMSPAIMASPFDTVRALVGLLGEGSFYIQILITLKRLVIGLAIGAVLGLVLGVFAGLKPGLRSFLEPLRWVGMTMPAVIIALLAMLWFGLGDVAVIFIVAVIVVPGMYVNTVAGVLAIDRRLVEMGGVYRLSQRLLLSEVYLPGIASPVAAGLTLAAGVAVRAVVLGEVLGAMDGIGYAFSRAMSYLETATVFAWILVLLALMALLEFGVLRPFKRRAMKWRKGGDQ
jgi:NitT/TauT family transport system permease protein